jgi:hypothetical protein
MAEPKLPPTVTDEDSISVISLNKIWENFGQMCFTSANLTIFAIF